MSKDEPPEEKIFQPGDRVRIQHTSHRQAIIVECLGPLGPQGAMVYRVRVGKRKGRQCLELCADLLEAADD